MSIKIMTMVWDAVPVPEAYRIKRHLMKAIHGIDILEIRS